MPHPLTPAQRDWLAVSLIPGLGPRLTAALLDEFGSISAVRAATAGQLRRVAHIGPALSSAIVQTLQALDLDAVETRLRDAGVDLLCRDDDDYPEPLHEIADAPNVLYKRGTLTPADRKAVALVGSRDCSGYGRRVAAKLARDLVSRGVTVVSGLARGIDAEAHKAALEAGGRTLAVLAGGLSRIYPPEHAGLADEVAASGALLTETAFDTSPLAGMFPARNRIISALSQGVVIVEANEKSGALITAKHAAEQGRTVYAVPGAVDSRFSAGCNALIRDGAILVRSADDILEDLGTPVPTRPARADRPNATPATVVEPALDGPAKRVWELLAGGPKLADELSRELGVSTGELTGVLLPMEMKKVVRRLPGNRYERG